MSAACALMAAGAALLSLAACASASAPPTAAADSAPVSLATPSVSPAPATATPIPPLTLLVHWPDQVSALQPTPIEVELLSLSDVPVIAVVRATVFDPRWSPYAQFDLTRREGGRYVSDDLLMLPLEPLTGDWRLVVDVSSAFDVEGERRVTFRPAPILFRDLSGVLPAGVSIRVPQAFEEVEALGDSTAGGRVWRYAGGEVALWWTPGPAEPLNLDTALVAAEATYGLDAPAVLDIEETAWQGQPAFRFREDWPGEGESAEALVVQGPDQWIYVLRLRVLDSEALLPLFQQVRDTFAFASD